MSLVFLVFLLGLSQPVLAQVKGDFQIAEQYYKQGEFEKAAEYYLKVYKKNRSKAYFDRYIKALVGAKDYKTAKKTLNKEIKRNPKELTYAVTLGDIYWRSDEKDKANKTWDQVISNLKKNQNRIITVAYLFTSLNQPNYALAAYKVGKETIPGFYSYYPQMADLYGVVGDYENMIELYLELIQVNPGYLQTVQTLLNRNFDFTEDNEQTQLIKRKLLQKTNQYPQNQMYAEMLIWLNLQQSNFEGAFIQVKSLDRRFKENGSRLINFARLSLKNEHYQVAEKAYQVVINKGSAQPYYETAKIEIISTQKKILDIEPTSDSKAYINLITEYEDLIEEFGIVNFTVPSVREMAEIHAQKLHSVNKSITLLELVLETPGILKKEVALTKIALGDYLLMQDKVWESVLYYMQAEKAFKYDELGDQAKLKAAKVYYYTGDFNWAASKLDILKGSTSKLISNDALYLSNLITDNITVDTNLHPMQMYAHADLLFAQQRYDEAFLLLDTLQSYYPSHSLADEVLMQKYKIRFAQKNYEKAAHELELLDGGYAYDILGDDALFLLGELYQNQLNDPKKAMEYYLLIMTNHPDSVFVTEARKRYRKLRGDEV